MFRPVPFRRRNRDYFMPQAFDSLFNYLEAPWQSFNVDVKETEKGYALHADLPGVAKENIQLSVEDGYLKIAVRQEQLESEDRENYIRRERRQMSSQRSFYVGNIQPEDVVASYENGVLEVQFPKTPDAPGKGQIPIQ